MVQAIVWETLQWRGSRIAADSGKEMGGEKYKTRIEEKKREMRDSVEQLEGRIGIIRMKLLRTLLRTDVKKKGANIACPGRKMHLNFCIRGRRAGE